LLNQEHKTDRLEKVTVLFDSLGIRPFTKITSIPSYNSNHDIAINESTTLTHKFAINSGVLPFIVYEDDININPDAKSFLLEIPDNTDVVYLGVNRCGMFCKDRCSYYSGARFEYYNDVISRVIETFCAHAILYITQKAVDIANRGFEISLKTGEPNDVCTSKLFSEGEVFAMNIPLFYQDDGAMRIRQTLFNVSDYMGRPNLCVDHCPRKRGARWYDKI